MSIVAVVVVVALLISVILHEIAHGVVALRLGDPTAKEQGRLTLNPLKHIDPFGSVLLPFLLAQAGQPVFGWAKPVPVDMRRLDDPKRDMIWVAAAGPLMNLLLAIVFTLIARTGRLSGYPLVFDVGSVFVDINILLATFNLIPLPPLDGGRVLTGLLPLRLAIPFSRLERFGLFILFGLLYLKVLNPILGPLRNSIHSTLLG